MNGKAVQQESCSTEEQFFLKNFIVNYALYFALAGMIIFLTLATNKFFTLSNIVNVLRQISVQAIIAIGMTMAIIMAQMDLSVGAVVAFASVCVALLLNAGVALPLAILLTLLFSAVWGLISGFVVAYFKLHAFLVTLAMMTLVRGVTYTMTGGYPVGGLPKSFFPLGAGYSLGIPYPVIYMIILYLIGFVVLKKTPFGRSIYSIGGNEDAARLSGIRIFIVKVSVFVTTAVLSAVAGIILSSRLMAGSPEIGQGWELDIIAAVVIGGTSISGGVGKLTGTMVGMLFVGILTNGMILLGVTPYMQQVVRGLVILFAVILNSMQEN
ncbi:MAG: ABC transporter permease [Proteiniphilum sp.]|nr:ABC transporter permease [Proteiniphilum sp.]